MSKNIAPVLFALILAALACGTTADDLATISVTVTPGVADTAAAADTATSPAGATAGPVDTAAPTEPPPTPTEPVVDLQLGKFGFGQDGRYVGWAFLVENDNAGSSFESTQYHVAVYDSAGTVLETDSGYLSLVLPGETTARSGTIILDEGVVADHIEVQLSSDDPVASDAVPSLGVESALYFPSDLFPAVTAIISSPYQRDVTDVQVSAVLYDDAGNIIGGAYTFLNFVLAGSQAGVHASAYSAGDVDKVEVYASISGLSLLTEPASVPAGASPITLDKQGFGQDDRYIGIGYVVSNPNAGFAVELSRFHTTAYAADGSVIDTDEGYLHLLLPGQTLGTGRSMIVQDGQTVDHIEVQVLAGRYEEAESLAGFTAENVTYKAGSFSASVTGQIASPYTKDISSLEVSAIGYDADGNIIGGGYTFLDFVPAGGKAAVEVPVYMSAAPELVELYAAVSALSDIKE